MASFARQETIETIIGRLHAGYTAGRIPEATYKAQRLRASVLGSRIAIRALSSQRGA